MGQNHGRGTPAEGGSDCGVVAAPGVGPAEEQVCRRLAEAVPLMLWTATAGGECDFVNARWYEVTGQARGGDPARGWSQVVHPADLPAAKAHWSGCVARGADFSAEFRLRDAQGAYRWHVARAVPLRDESGRVLKWFGACSDVDDRRRAERDREFLSAIVEGSEDAVVGLGLDGAVTFWSEGAHRLFGYSSSEVLGRPVGDLLPPPGAGRRRP
ncbi:MAG: PAS domain S-box protein [Isosphaeraceae bacterium]